MSVVSVRTVPEDDLSVLVEFMFFNEEHLSNNISYRSPGHGVKGTSNIDVNYQRHGEICNSPAHIAALLSRIFIHTNDWNNKFKACGGRDNMLKWWKNWALGRKAGEKRERERCQPTWILSLGNTPMSIKAQCINEISSRESVHLVLVNIHVHTSPARAVIFRQSRSNMRLWLRVLAVDYRWLVFGIFLLWYPLNVLTPFEAMSVLKISRPFYVQPCWCLRSSFFPQLSVFYSFFGGESEDESNKNSQHPSNARGEKWGKSPTRVMRCDMLKTEWRPCVCSGVAAG